MAVHDLQGGDGNPIETVERSPRDMARAIIEVLTQAAIEQDGEASPPTGRLLEIVNGPARGSTEP